MNDEFWRQCWDGKYHHFTIVGDKMWIDGIRYPPSFWQRVRRWFGY
jgi:hypothetical protein